MKKFVIQKISLMLVIIGSLNWGLTALNYNVVEMLNLYINSVFKSNIAFNKIIYLVIIIYL